MIIWRNEKDKIIYDASGCRRRVGGDDGGGKSGGDGCESYFN